MSKYCAKISVWLFSIFRNQALRKKKKKRKDAKATTDGVIKKLYQRML